MKRGFKKVWGIFPTVDGILIVFALPQGSPVAARRRRRKRVYGEATSSWEGRYQYRRRGLFDEIRRVLLYTGVVIVRPEDAGRVLHEVRALGAEATRREIRLTAGDERALGYRAG